MSTTPAPLEFDLDLPEFATTFPIKVGGQTYEATCPSVEQMFALQAKFTTLEAQGEENAGAAVVEALRAFWETLQLPPEALERVRKLRLGAQMAVVKRVFGYLSTAI